MPLACCGFRGHEDKIVTKELECGYDETEVQTQDVSADWQIVCATPGLQTPWAGPYSSGILRPIMHLGLPV